MSEREILTWELFGSASRQLAQAIADDYMPDMMLSIARGGLLIGGALGYALSIKNVYTMNVEFYTGVDERLDVPRILPPAPDFVDLHDAKILIADDVTDTGHTLRSVQSSAPEKSARSGPLSSTWRVGRWSSVTMCGDAPTAGSTFPGATRIRSYDER